MEKCHGKQKKSQRTLILVMIINFLISIIKSVWDFIQKVQDDS